MTVFAQTAVLYLSAAWLSFVGSGMIGEAIAVSEHLSRRRLDSQLIRLGTRFVGIVIAIGFLIQGANELGFPAYSVVAGLGVGGVAVALAARDSLANLLGSMLIMFEKPFRVGDTIRVSGSEGTVEDVGFRSTRIRTLDNSLVSIPNNTVVNTTIENLAARVMRRQRFFIQVTYDTDPGKGRGVRGTHRAASRRASGDQQEAPSGSVSTNSATAASISLSTFISRSGT